MKPNKQKEKQFVKLFSQTMTSLTDIAKKLHVSRFTVHKWRLKHFPDLLPGKRKYEAFKELHKSGLMIDQIASLLKMPRNSVLRLRRQTVNAKIKFKMPIPPPKIDNTPETSRQVTKSLKPIVRGVFSKN